MHRYKDNKSVCVYYNIFFDLKGQGFFLADFKKETTKSIHYDRSPAPGLLCLMDKPALHKGI